MVRRKIKVILTALYSILAKEEENKILEWERQSES